MPSPVRDAIVAARRGRGVAAEWLVARGRGWGQVGASVQLLRDRRVATDLAGWLAGIAMFGDDTDRIAEALEGHAAARSALDAFVAGVRAGVDPAPGQWQRIERLTSAGHAGLASVLPVAAGSQSSEVRQAARKLARKLGRDAQVALDAARTTASGAERRRLAAAGTALGPRFEADGERGALLLRLLDGWRATRAVELEEPIAQLGAELARTREPLADKSRVVLETKWQTVARRKDPLDVTRLLEASWPKSLDAARRRVELFAKFLPDPRITRGIATSAAKHRSESSLRFHRSVAQLIVGAPMREAVAAIDAIEKAHDAPEIVEIYAEARELCAGLPTMPPDATILAELAQAKGGWADLDSLWAAHVADPGDLATRAVLGDALQRAGDPRGEFIALQLAGATSSEAKQRINELLRAHADAWTGPIPLVSKTARRFERGFLVALSSRGIGHELTATFARREWVTIEDLFIDGASTVLAQLVKRMPLLRRLATPHADLVAQLARTGRYPSIEAIATNRGWLAANTAFPNLRVVAGHWAVAEAVEVQRTAAALGLTAIVHLGFPIPALRAALSGRDVGPPELRFAFGDGTGGFGGSSGGFAGFTTPGWRARVFRDRREAELAWGGGPSHVKEQKAEIVQQLSRAVLTVKEVKRIELSAP